MVGVLMDSAGSMAGASTQMSRVETSAEAGAAPGVHRGAEASLVRAALAGDGAAFGRLVAPHVPMMLRVAGRGCGDAALAEDAVQESLTIVWHELGRYQPGTSLRAFLASVVAKRTHTLLRGEARRRARQDGSRAPERPASPDEALVGRDLEAAIREELAALPDKKQRAVLLRLDAGLSYAEIAEAIGSTEASSRVMVSQALKALRAALRDRGVAFGGGT
jgi:RNA polymerase sigma-70 factor (ECF subfamily)